MKCLDELRAISNEEFVEYLEDVARFRRDGLIGDCKLRTFYDDFVKEAGTYLGFFMITGVVGEESSVRLLKLLKGS